MTQCLYQVDIIEFLWVFSLLISPESFDNQIINGTIKTEIKSSTLS